MFYKGQDQPGKGGVRRLEDFCSQVVKQWKLSVHPRIIANIQVALLSCKIVILFLTCVCTIR